MTFLSQYLQAIEQIVAGRPMWGAVFFLAFALIETVVHWCCKLQERRRRRGLRPAAHGRERQHRQGQASGRDMRSEQAEESVDSIKHAGERNLKAATRQSASG